MLATGDRREVAEAVAAGLAFDALRAELTPDQKVMVVLSERNAGPVMMIGDDVNDAPAAGRGRRRHRHRRKWRGGIGRATALPFLTRASWVTVIELCTSDEHDAAQLRVRDVAKYLERRGARCRYGVHVHMAERTPVISSGWPETKARI